MSFCYFCKLLEIQWETYYFLFFLKEQSERQKKKIALCSNSVLDIFFLPKLPNYMPPMPIVNFPHRHNTMIKMLLLNDFFVILCPHGERLALFLDVGIQNEPPQDVPQWYMAYFEKKANKTLQVQKKLLLSS